jgi:hypothetical protein
MKRYDFMYSNLSKLRLGRLGEVGSSCQLATAPLLIARLAVLPFCIVEFSSCSRTKFNQPHPLDGERGRDATVIMIVAAFSGDRCDWVAAPHDMPAAALRNRGRITGDEVDVRA